MLKLRGAVVREVLASAGRGVAEQSLVVELDGEPGLRRAAIADSAMIGRCEVGDEVVVNVQALDLGLGSGGFDVVHANLTRGLSAEGTDSAHVMKLNYTSLQHAVGPVEGGEDLRVPLGRPVAVLALHGQLAPLAWAFAQSAPGRVLGYVQTEGGALPAARSRTAAELRRRGLLARHLTAGAAFGGDGEAITTAGALHHGLGELGWDAAVCGPGPGIVGSSSALGHGGMFALDSAHAALALGCPAVVAARMSGADPRPRHRGLSHHTRTVLELLLAPAIVALPGGGDDEVTRVPDSARLGRHDWRVCDTDLDGFVASGLPAETMGRGVAEDPLFFDAALAAGAALASAAGVGAGEGTGLSGQTRAGLGGDDAALRQSRVSPGEDDAVPGR
jgi:hypothetical protein